MVYVTTCGIIVSSNGSYELIYCNADNGDVIYDSDSEGAILFDSLTIHNPLIMDEQNMSKFVSNFPGATGAIFTKDYVIIIINNQFTYRKLDRCNDVFKSEVADLSGCDCPYKFEAYIKES